MRGYNDLRKRSHRFYCGAGSCGCKHGDYCCCRESKSCLFGMHIFFYNFLIPWMIMLSVTSRMYKLQRTYLIQGTRKGMCWEMVMSLNVWRKTDISWCWHANITFTKMRQIFHTYGAYASMVSRCLRSDNVEEERDDETKRIIPAWHTNDGLFREALFMVNWIPPVFSHLMIWPSLGSPLLKTYY